MSFDSPCRYFTLCVLAIVLATVVAQEFNLEDNVKELIARKKNLEFMRQLVDDMNNQLTRLQKRTCYYNAGMSHNCDYNAMNNNLDQELNWDPQAIGPGKRSSPSSSKEDVRTLLRSMKDLAANRRRR